MYRSPFLKFTRQHPPLAGTFQQIQHTAKHLVEIYRSRLGLFAYAFQQGPDLFERFLAYVTGVTLYHAPVYDMLMILISHLSQRTTHLASAGASVYTLRSVPPNRSKASPNASIGCPNFF